MHPDALAQLNESLLDKIKLMFSSGSTIEQILDVLSGEEPNDSTYKFYLEAACGEKLDGSIFLFKWNLQDQKTRQEILGYLEFHAERIRKT